MRRVIVFVLLLGAVFGCKRSAPTEPALNVVVDDDKKRPNPNPPRPQPNPNDPTPPEPTTGGPGAVPALLVGKWVGTDKPGEIEFRANGTFRSTLDGTNQEGTYRSLGEHRIELNHNTGRGSWPNAEVYVSKAELRVLRIGNPPPVDGRKLEGLAIPYNFRREGKAEVVPGEGLGGTADDLRKAIVGRWLANHDGPWEFLPDGTVKRLFYPFSGTYKILDGHRIEITDKEGKLILDIVHHNGFARATQVALNTKGIRPTPDLKLRRLPADNTDYDPAPGKLSELIVGTWQFPREDVIFLGQDAYEFRADGTWQSIQTKTKYTLKGTYHFLDDRTIELTTEEPKGTSGYHVTITKGGRLGLHWVSSGTFEQSNSLPQIYQRVK